MFNGDYKSKNGFKLNVDKKSVTVVAKVLAIVVMTALVIGVIGWSVGVITGSEENPESTIPEWKEPITEPTVQQPTTTPEWKEPITEPTVQQPTTTPEWKEPTTEPTVQQPTTTPTWVEPTVQPTVQQPTTTPEWKEPVQSTGTEVSGSKKVIDLREDSPSHENGAQTFTEPDGTVIDLRNVEEETESSTVDNGDTDGLVPPPGGW